MIARALVTLSAAIVFGLGALHLLYTFWGRRFHPRDAALEARMREVTPVLTRHMTMWNAWIGFNVTHSLGALQYGVIYGYLALAAPAFLFQSWFLRLFGLLLLASYLATGKAYWFRVPFLGVLAALVCYAGGLAAGLAGF